MIKLYPVLDSFYIEGFNEITPCNEQLFLKELCVMSKKYNTGLVNFREKEYIQILITQIDPSQGDAFSLLVHNFKEWEALINGIFEETE